MRMLRRLGLFLLVTLSVDAHAAVGRRCTTQQHRLRIANARYAAEDRPVLPQVITSTVHPIAVHFDPAVTSMARAQLVRTLAEQAWDVEVTQMGWTAPFPDDGIDGGDALDFYFDDLGDGSAYSAPDGNGPIMGRDASSSFVVLDQDIPDEELPYFVCHEFNHVLQFVRDDWESDYFWEATASYVEFVTQPTAVTDTDYLQSFQFSPQDALDDFEHFDTYEYGAAYFLFFISQRYFNGSHDIVRDLWRDSAQLSTGAIQVNEPDHLDVLAQRLAPVTLLDAFAEFSRWRSFGGEDDDGMHVIFPEVPAPGWEMARERILTWAQLPTEVALRMAETGSQRVDVELTNLPQGAAVVAELHNQTHEVEVSLLAIAPDRTLLRSEQQRGHDIRVQLGSLSGVAEVRIIVVNLGDGAHDPDDNEWTASPFQLRLSQASGDAPDAGVTPADAGVTAGSSTSNAAAGGGGDTPAPVTPGCSHSTVSPGAPACVMVLLISLWVVRRRAARRV